MGMRLKMGGFDMRGCRPLSDHEIDDALDYLSSPLRRRERALFLLGIRTGLRLTSLLSLRVGDVSVCGEVRDRIRVRRCTVKGGRAGFDMPLHREAAQALQDYLDSLVANSPSGYVFPGRRRGTHLHRTQGWRLLKAAFEAVGLSGGYGELGAHSLRKTFAGNIYSALNHDLVRTARAMRHASVSTTVQYLSFREEEVGCGDSGTLNDALFVRNGCVAERSGVVKDT